MSGQPRDELDELQTKLKEVNDEYRLLVRKCPDQTRLERMAELKKQRLDVVTAIFHIEQALHFAD